MALTRPFLVAAGAAIALGLAACSSSSLAHVSAGQGVGGPSTSSTSAATTTTAGPAAPTSTTTTSQVPPGWKQVTYQSVHFAVPGNWPVYNLTSDPNRCLTLNVHAVYLGHVGAHPSCPATALGKTDAVHVEPLDSQSRAQVVLGPSPTPVAGQPALTDPASATTRSLVVALQRSAILITLSYNTSPALDQSILAT